MKPLFKFIDKPSPIRPFTKPIEVEEVGNMKLVKELIVAMEVCPTGAVAVSRSIKPCP